MSEQSFKLIGTRFGRLIVIAKASTNPTRALCRCDCGKVKDIHVSALYRGATRSCGCLLREGGRHLLKHGRSSTRTYRIWALMKSRASPNNAQKYPNHAGRGISVCERWMTFENFFADMGESPPGYSIERLDNDGNYEPSNCAWIPLSRQWANRRNTVLAVIDGKAIPLPDLARANGIKRATADARVKDYGWSPERAGTEPVR